MSLVPSGLVHKPLYLTCYSMCILESEWMGKFIFDELIKSGSQQWNCASMWHNCPSHRTQPILSSALFRASTVVNFRQDDPTSAIVRLLRVGRRYRGRATWPKVQSRTKALPNSRPSPRLPIAGTRTTDGKKKFNY